jgi:hypothetical protein
MYALFCGSRDWTDSGPVTDVISKLPTDTTIIAGGAPGVDTIAEQVAHLFNLEVIRIDADWESFGKAAGPIRNTEMLNVLLRAAKLGWPIRVYAFHEDPKLRRGTRDMVRQSMQAGIIPAAHISTPLSIKQVSGDVICNECKLPYWKHSEVISMLSRENSPYLHLGCDGFGLKCVSYA